MIKNYKIVFLFFILFSNTKIFGFWFFNYTKADVVGNDSNKTDGANSANTQSNELSMKSLNESSSTASADNNNTNVNPELAKAVRGGNLDKVKSLLGSGANPSYVDSTGTPLLTLAILSGKYSGSESHISVIKLLIEHGANVNAVDANGFTALDILNLPIMSGIAPHPNLLKARQRYGKEVNSILESKGAIHSPNWDEYKKSQDKLSVLVSTVNKK